jgi:DNA repair protein RadA/Sms
VLAVLARHGGISLGSSDVFVSVAGGVRVSEPGADLAVALALASAAKGVQLGGERPLAAFGELGLTGELREAAHPDRRLAEARKFGLDTILHPAGSLRTLRDALKAARAGRSAAAA